MRNPRTILITGASSGIGAALARHYAAPRATLHLQGRNAERLEIVAAFCRASGATVFTTLLDVTDRQGMERWVYTADNASPLELVIANAGISSGTGDKGESTEQVHSIMATNVGGVVNTVQPALSAMLVRGRGQIAIVSSLAGIRGLPGCPTYSASKACVRYWAEGLRGWAANKGIEVNAICPGYIKTPMTDVNDFPMPFLMSPEKAVRIIARGLERNKSRIAFPASLYIPLWFLSCLSPRLTDAFFARLPAKPATPV